VRCAAAATLVRLQKFALALPVLIHLLDTPFAVNRVRVVYIITLVPPEYSGGSALAIERLLRAASRSDAARDVVQSQVLAAEHLMRLGETEKALAALTRAAADQRDDVTRESARSVLQRLKPKTAVGKNP
jgi:hypothetical protein